MASPATDLGGLITYLPRGLYIKELEKFYMDKFDLLGATKRARDLKS